MNNEMWSQKPLIEELSETTEFCILDEAIPKNKRINAKTLLDAKANVSDLNNVDNTSDLNKPISTAQQTALDLKAPKENAEFTGSMTLNGYPVSTNDLNGTNYVMVYGTGTPTENAAELQAAYNEAKKMPRYLGDFEYDPPLCYVGQTYHSTDVDDYYRIDTVVDGLAGIITEITEAEAKSVRTTVIVAPGEYNFGATKFVVDTTSVNIVSLTGNNDVMLDGIRAVIDNVYIKGINCGLDVFEIGDNLPLLVCENCRGDIYSFSARNNDNVGEVTSGTFINCIGGRGSFGGNESCVVSGKFINCTGGDYAFGGSGVFGVVSGTFTNCIAGNNSFGGDDGSIVSGRFTNCTAGSGSWGGWVDFPSGIQGGILESCRLTSGTFQAVTLNGKIYNCINGNGALVNYPTMSYVESNLSANDLKFSAAGYIIPTKRELEILAAYGLSLSKSYLCDLDLTSIILVRTNLSYCECNNTIFNNATLTNCIFKGAAFGGARFTGANLSNSDFTGATQMDTNINIALAGAYGNNVIWTDGLTYSFDSESWVVTP